VSVLAKTERERIFAANRATGRIALTVAAQDGRTRRTRVHEAGSLRVRFPKVTDGALEAVIVNTGGGMTGGDRFSIDVSVGSAGSLVVGTTAAEKIYRSTGADAETNVSLTVGAGAHLAWLPQECILFDRARLSRRINIELTDDASLVMAEAVVFGRAAMGETMREGSWSDRWRLRRGGSLVFAENARLDGAVARSLAAPAVASESIALATVLVTPGDETTCTAVRALDEAFTGEVGISAWNGIAVARLVAGDGATLRHDLIALLASLGMGVPRLWLQ
jgi:urease accessory protein